MTRSRKNTRCIYVYEVVSSECKAAPPGHRALEALSSIHASNEHSFCPRKGPALGLTLQLATFTSDHPHTSRH